MRRCLVIPLLGHGNDCRQHFSLGHGIFYLCEATFFSRVWNILSRRPPKSSWDNWAGAQIGLQKNWAIGRRSRSHPRTATPSSHRGTAARCPAAASTKTRSARPYGRYAQGWFRSNNGKSPLSSIGGVWAPTGDSFTTMSRLSEEIRPERSKGIGI